MQAAHDVDRAQLFVVKAEQYCVEVGDGVREAATVLDTDTVGITEPDTDPDGEAETDEDREGDATADVNGVAVDDDVMLGVADGDAVPIGGSMSSEHWAPVHATPLTAVTTAVTTALGTPAATNVEAKSVCSAVSEHDPTATNCVANDCVCAADAELGTTIVTTYVTVVCSARKPPRGAAARARRLAQLVETDTHAAGTPSVETICALRAASAAGV